MKSKSIVLGVVLSLLLSSGSLSGRTKEQGARLHLFKKDGHEQEGELIGVKKSSLVLYQSDTDFMVDIRELLKIKVLKKSTRSFRSCAAEHGFRSTDDAIFLMPFILSC